MEMAMKDRKKLIIGVVAGGLMMPDRHRYSVMPTARRMS
jgi:hypothetical protein